MNDLSGTVIKGYELRELIGAGGFGAIYRAYQQLVRREVAIKVILPEFANHPDFIRRFEAEAQLVAHLEHPHIVPLYDYWREPGGAYLVMRWLRGGSLRNLLDHGEWDVKDTPRLIDQIGSALAVSHANGVIHRDLKPDNILTDEANNAYLADFGIAKDLQNITGTAQDDQDAEEEGMIFGSLAYFAPEQIQGLPVGPQADIYSLGIVLYELLAGRSPFHGMTAGAIIHKHLYESLPPLSQANGDLPPEIDEIIQRATQKNAADRYASVRDFIMDFHRVLTLRGDGLGQIQTRETQTMGLNYLDLTIYYKQPLGELEPENPYKGLRAFQEADADDFYGRSKLIERLLDRMQEQHERRRFLAVVGPSGSGKSSVVKAGVIPALRSGQLPGSYKWFIVEMVPGVYPMREMENALLSVATKPPGDLYKRLRADVGNLAKIVNEILPPDDSELVILIDQFEEIFTQVEEEAERAHFLNSLIAATDFPGSRLRLFITLRADFYDRPLLYPRFGELVRERTEVVLPLNSEELEQAIVMPAENVGLSLETGLVTSIVADVGEQPGALPLLQYALTELYERRDGPWLTLKAYNDIGGVSGALARRADELYLELDAEGQRVARQMFLRLVTLGEGTEDTRRRVHQSELLSLQGSETAMGRVIEMFGKYRLLTFDRDPQTRVPTVEVAHEALIRQWARLREWLNSNREDLRLQARLSNAAEEWRNSGRDASFLASGARLDQFEAWSAETELVLTNMEAEYLQASLAERDKERAAELARQQKEAALERRSRQRLRALVLVMAAAAVVAVFLWRDAVSAREVADTNRAVAVEQAQVALARQLAAQARGRLTAARPEVDVALLLSVESDRIADSLDRTDLPEIRSVLFDTVNVNRLRSVFLHGHNLRVAQIAFSPGSNALASVDMDGTVILWDLARAAPVITLNGQTYGIRSVAFSSDGRTLATGSWDGTILLWDAATGEQKTALRGAARSIEFMAFTPDNAILAAGSPDGLVALWDVGAGTVRATLREHTNRLRSLAISPDGQLLATGSDDNTVVLWNIAQNTRLGVLAGHTGGVRSLAFSPDSRRVATGTWGGAVFLWDVGSLENTAALSGHERGIEKLAFSPDGARLISQSWDGEIIEWAVSSGQQLGILNAQDSGTNIVAFSPSIDMLAFGNQDGSVVVDDRLTGEATPPLRGHSALVSSVAFSPDGRLLVSASQDGKLILWNVADRVLLSPPFRHEDVVNSIAFSPDGSRLVSGSFDRRVILWDVASRTPLATLSEHTDAVLTVAFSPDGTRLASAGWDRSVLLWDAESGRLLSTMGGHTNWITRVVFSPDGALLASASDDGTVRLWNGQTGAPVATLEGDMGRINALRFSPDGKLLAAGGESGAVQVWDVATRSEQAILSGHDNAVFALAFSPDSALLVSGGFDNNIVLWDVAQAEALATLSGHSSLILSLAFSPDGSVIASGSDDGTAILWSVSGRGQIARLADHSGGVNAVAFSPDGQFLATGSWDRQVILWDVASQRAVAHFADQNGGINAVAFSPDGGLLASASDDGTVMLWDVSPQSWRARACQTANRNMTQDEWRLFMGAQPYHQTCPDV